MNELPEGYIAVPASAWQELVRYELKCQELSAQVEDLKSRIGAFAINIERNEKIGASVKEEVAKMFNGIGENHLRQVQADAVREFSYKLVGKIKLKGYVGAQARTELRSIIELCIAEIKEEYSILAGKE